MSGGKLPEGWQASSIGDLCKKVTDGSHNPPKASETGLPMLSAKNINNGSIVFSETHRIISEAEFWEENKRTSIESGDVLLTIVGTLGRTAVVPQDFTPFTLQRSVAVLSTSVLEPSYFRYALENREFQIQIHENSKGTAQKGIYLNALKKLTINIAPKNEQKIIAEKLDTLLAQVDSTKARLELIPQILKRFRQAVLVSAVNGKLQAESSNKECCTIDSLCITSFDGPFGSKLKTSDYTNSGIRVVRLENIGHLEFNSEKETYISHEKYKSLYSNTLKENDLIFSSFVDEDVRVCLMPQSEQTFINKADCFCLRVNPSLASPHYLALVLASKTSYEQIKEKVQGITRPRINLRTLRSLKFDIPDLKDQLEIVRRVEQLFAYADSIEKQVNSALTRVNSLTQSILAKAFRGELTAQWRAENPSLISGENSATALLEKIKAERAASGGKKTSRKKS